MINRGWLDLGVYQFLKMLALCGLNDTITKKIYYYRN